MTDSLPAHRPSARDPSGVVLPGGWLGMLGGGQLGRMFTHAAQAMGYRVCVLDPDPASPAGAVAERHLCADYTDEAALAEIAALCPAVTTEFENVPARTLDRLEQLGARVAPRASCVSIAQDRLAEKAFFARCAARTGIDPAPYRAIGCEADIDALPADLLPGILKTARMGYDGRGQARVSTHDALRAAWRACACVPCVLEKMLPLACEASVIAARAADGSIVTWPLAENVHRDGILFSTAMPARSVAAETALRMREAAGMIAQAMDYVGVLCVEFFVLQDGALVVNEMAPRPHNSGHLTMDACETSQFEQQVRTTAGLPLGDTRQHSSGRMLNVLGQAWFDGARERAPAWCRALRHAGVKVHLYGKAGARAGRKMGHVNCVGASPELADAAFRHAAQALGLHGD